MTTRGWKQFTPFYFYMVVVLCSGVAAARAGEHSVTGILLLMVCGFLSWTLVEYVLHRFIFHFEARSERSRQLLYLMHQAHHDHPQAVDHLFASLTLSLPIAACYCLLARVILGSWSAVAFLFAGLVIGYFCYEWLHYQAHHGKPGLRLFRYLKKYHLLHHHQTPGLRFGVTSPVLDYLFGTYRPIKAKGLWTRTGRA